MSASAGAPPAVSTSTAAVSDPLVRKLVGVGGDDPAWERIVLKTWAYVEEFMSHYDASHDFAHIRRVTTLALGLHERTVATGAATARPLCPRTIALAALLHDVGDRKYLLPTQDASTMVLEALTDIGCDPALAARVQTVCTAVSYSGEVRDPGRVTALIAGEVPELAVVQDADRLDAIGAVGIGRTFAYGGATRGKGGLEGVLEHFTDKLVLLEGMMKTEAGRELARVRTERLHEFRGWWAEETSGGGGD